MARRTPFLALLALLSVVLVAAGWAVFNAAHPDGAGPLGSVGEPVHEGMRVDPGSADSTWTFGVPLCLASGATPAVLSDVSPIAVDGDGFRFLGSGVRTFVWSEDHAPILSVGGWPPPMDVVPDELSPVAGYEVSTACHGEPDQWRYTELLIGFERVGSDGGGWEGLHIGYTVNGDRKVLRVDRDMKICGMAVSCDLPNDEPS